MVATGGHVVMVMQGDGNLVERRDGALVWATYTQGHPGAWAVMQGDGNFVIYTPQEKSHSGIPTPSDMAAHTPLCRQIRILSCTPP